MDEDRVLLEDAPKHLPVNVKWLQYRMWRSQTLPSETTGRSQGGQTWVRLSDVRRLLAEKPGRANRELKSVPARKGPLAP